MRMVSWTHIVSYFEIFLGESEDHSHDMGNIFMLLFVNGKTDIVSRAFNKQPLDSWTPGILEPFSPTLLEANPILIRSGFKISD